MELNSGSEHRRYVYVIVREDLELKDKIVQSAHAAYDSALNFKNHADRTSIIILSLGNKSINDAVIYLKSVKIKYIVYKEISLGFGETAIATEALTESQRKHLRKFKLLQV